MEAPYTIASLPKPLDGEDGNVQAAPVYGIKGSRKRKRHEVAVGVDGEGVNVYNISTQTLVTSYALPPQSYLCCPPCPIYIRRPKPAAVQRRTYLVLRDGPHDRKRRLVCLTEELQAPGQDIDDLQTSSKKEYRLADGNVVGLDVLPGPDSEPQVIVSYTNGEIQCIAGDLSKRFWRHNDNGVSTSADTKAAYDLEHVGLTDLETACKGLLAGREDVVATLDISIGGSSINRQLLYRMVRTGEGRALRLYSVRDQQLQSQQKYVLQNLITLDLPDSSSKHAKNVCYEVHSATGKVYVQAREKLSIYDLSGTIPRMISTLGNRSEPVLSFTRLSATTLLVTQADKAVVYETKYGSALAEMPLQSGQNTTRAGEKRKRTDQSTQQAWNVTTSFQDLGIAVGLAGTELMGIQFADELRSMARNKSKEIALASVLGKGLQDAARSSQEATRKWELWTSRVDEAVRTRDVQATENIVARALEFTLQQPSMAEVDDTLVTAGYDAKITNVDGPEDVVFDTAKIDRRKVLYLLSKLFRMISDEEATSSERSRLVTTVQSSTVYEWLALTGYLTSSTLQQAFKLYRTDVTVVSMHLGDVMHALRDFDGTFHLVRDLLEENVFWDLPEIMQVLRLLMQSLETPADGSTQKLRALPVPPFKDANRDVAMVNGDAESHADSEAQLAERELDLAFAALQSGLHIRSDTLRLVLGRLEAFPRPSVTKAMRAMLRQEDLVFFLKIMRIELLEGGWHQRYIVFNPDDYPQRSDDDVAPSDKALAQIAWLIDCAVDAIGISGFLVGQSAEVLGMHQFVNEMKAEVSAALEGLYENDNLKGQLNELERFAFASRHVKRGEEDAQGVVNLEERLLPMGCKPALGTQRVSSEKGEKKGAHAHAAEKRASIGDYSFERIRI